MKIVFVYPRFEKFLADNIDLDNGLVDYFLGDFTTPPSLGIPILASLTPADIEVELIDDNAGDAIDYSAPADLVAINCFTPQATRAFEIADQYRAHGKKVVMGGLFPSFMVGDCLQHADAVNIGEGEPTWEQIIADAKRGCLKPRYEGGCRFDLSKMRIPRRDIFYSKKSYDWDEDLVQLTRGCSYACSMCAIPAHMGNRIRFRPIEQVVEEIRTLKFENVYLADDTLFFPHRKVNEYARALFKALIPLQKKYFVSSTLALNIDREFIDLAARAGVRNFYCTMNVDPISIRALQGEKKERAILVDLVKMLNDRGIRFFGSCALGRDWDDASIADRILELFFEADIHTAEFFLFTPYPGSVHWDRMERQGRIIDRTWSHYNGAHVVARPLKMTPEQLYGQFIKVWNEFFRAQKKETRAASLEPATYEAGIQVVGKPLQRKGVRHQAVVTGMGFFSPIGNDFQTVIEALLQGKDGLGPITRFDASPFRSNLAGEVRNFNPREWLSACEIAEYDDLYLHYAIAAARKAICNAGIEWNGPAIQRDVALVLGTCNGGLLSAEAEYAWKHGRGGRPFDEKMNLLAQYYGFGKAMARALGIGGEVWVVTTACSSTTVALGLARMLIGRGYYTTVIVGGADTLCLANFSGFDALKAICQGRTAPFSLPIGLNIGEGACFWVVEDMEKALLRHARCLAKIAGYATTCDAYHPTAPDPRGEGVFRTLCEAMEDAGLHAGDIGCINTHGTGTEANDKAESKGISRLIGNAAVPAVSTKSFFGHCMGVAGILEATCNVLAMNAGFIPPTIHFTVPRPGCNLDYVPNKPRFTKYHAFLSANYAFGGNNAAVVITTWDYELPRREITLRPVVITGSGTVTSLGLGTEQLVRALRQGGRGFVPMNRVTDPRVRASLAGLVPAFDAREIGRGIDFGSLNPISRYAVAAAKMALDNAGIRIGQANAARCGIAMGVCNGPSEMGHMDSVFSTPNAAADLASFSNIVPNSTAGWTANMLNLKGVNISLASGPHAGLQALAYAYEIVSEERADCMLAAAADEVYEQTYSNYDRMEFLYYGDAERNYRLRLDETKRKVLGEGAAALVLETLPKAHCRNARILAEILGYGMSMDGGPFTEQNMDPEGLIYALSLAIKRAKVDASEVDAIVWAPQGNAQDAKMIKAVEALPSLRSDIPFLTTTFNTGYIESASILVGIAAALECIWYARSMSSRGAHQQPDGQSEPLFWPQLTGLARCDQCSSKDSLPRLILAIGSTDVGYNYAIVLKTDVTF